MALEFIPFSLNATNFIILFSFLLLVIRIWQQRTKSSDETTMEKLPPGPPKLPIIGNIHNLLGALPHFALKNVSDKYGPLTHLKLGEVSAVVVSSAQIAKEVLVTHDPAFADRPGRLASDIVWYNQKNMAFSPYGDYWKQMRKICMMELLSGKNVRSFNFIREDEISNMVSSIRSSLEVPINMTDKLFSYTSSMTCRAAFGRICKDKEIMIQNIKEGTALAGGFHVTDLFPSLKFLPVICGLKKKLLMMRAKNDLILDDVIDQHKRNHENGRKGNAESGDEDLMDVLLRLKDSGSLQFPITDINIKAVIYDMFTAGTDTSSATSEWALSELMKNPRVLAKAQAEVREVCKGKTTVEEADILKMEYLKVVIKETLRLHPPIPLLPRASRENRKVNGYMIPNKSQVLVNAWAIMRDPACWDEPETFKPERFEHKNMEYMGTHFEYIPFGTGRRSCPGMTFGLANVEQPLAHLLFNFDWKLPNGMLPEELDMDEIPGITVTRKNNLCLVATAFQPAIAIA